MHTCELPENQPTPLTDAEMIAYLTDLIERRAAVTICREFDTFQARACWPWVGRASYLLGEGRTLGHAMADLKLEDERHNEPDETHVY